MIHNSLLLRFGLKKMAEGSHCSARWHRRISNEHGDFKRKHPSHLRGKEIGLYYANRGKKRQREEINLDTEQFELINSFLDQKSPFGDENRVISSLIESLNCDKVKTYHHGNRAEFILKQNEELDQIFLKEKNEIDKGGKMQEFRKNLPAYKFKEKILDVLNKNQVVVICGETGCGKTTQVAQFILDDYISKGKGSLCSVVCTQPRRISAISVAERVTEERNSVCGRNGCAVGYQIRLENRRPRKQGSIMFCTPGILLQELQNNPHFYGYSHVILDEIHERDLNTDLLIIIIRQILKKNQDLRVILMSATLNADEISTYFGNCSIINIPGFTYPVQEFYLEDIVQNIGYNVTQAMKKNTKINGPKWKKYTSEGKRLLREAENVEIEQFNYFESIKNKYPHDVINTLQNLDLEKLPLNLYLNLIKHICKSQKQGAILVFLTGWMEIKDLHKLISNDPFFKTNKSKIIPLHSMMPTVNQKDIFERPPPGVRKIILSTNIAETSITIDDVVYVINNGKAKISNYDEEKNLSTLQPEWISLANSKQRKGRAGRVQPGICYHAYTQYQHSKLRNYQLPEMLRTRLEQICLRIKLLKLGNISQFLSEAMNSPSSKAVEQSITILKQLNAFDDNEELTALGYHLARLPLDPQIGKMILLGSIFSCLDPILTVAASISFKDPFVFPLGKENLADIRKVELSNQTNSDHFAFINAVKGWEEAKSNGNVHRFVNHHFLSQNILKSLTDMKRQLAEYLVSLKFLDVPDEKDPRFNINSDNEQLIKAIICAGLYPNIIQCHNKKPKKQSRSDHYQQNKQKRLPRTRTQLEVVSLHPKSVNCKVDYFNSPWLVYHLKVKSTQIFIYDSTMVTALQLVFFGGQLDLVKDCGVELISIDKWIEFKVSHSKAKAIMNLRNLLNEFLAFKIKHPGATIWDPSESHFPMLTVIRDIVACNDF